MPFQILPGLKQGLLHVFSKMCGQLLKPALLLAGLFMLATSYSVAQQYQTVAVTGYNADIIADGASFAGSVTADADNAGYYFLNQTFTAFGTPAFALPSNGTINSLATSGLSFQMAPASQPNSLRLIAVNASGTLSFTSPVKAGTVYLLATSGSGASDITATLQFSDGSTQVISPLSVADWYGGSPTAAQGFGRTNATALDNGGGATNPRLYQVALAVNPANYAKSVTAVSITKTSASGALQVMGVSVNVACDAPAAQPTSLLLNAISVSQIDGSFTASAAQQYLVVRYQAGATETVPSNGVVYAPGGQLGAGTVIQAGTGTSFSTAGLSGSTSYDFYVYGYNAGACAGPVYLLANPLKATKATAACSGPAGIVPVGPSATYATLTSALLAVAGGHSGPVVFELQNNYNSMSEAFPIAITSNGCLSASNNITIRPAANAPGMVISASNAGPTIDLSGAAYVTIDGRPGGTGTAVTVTPSGSKHASYLNIINTNTAGVAIRFDNQSSNNRIVYCDLQGQNNTGANVPNGLAGVVYFGNAGGAGNDLNLLSKCNIHAAGTGTDIPSIGVYALGVANTGPAAGFNDKDTIADCNIYDFFLANGNSAGVELNQGVDSWVIRNNHFFQRNALTFTGAGYSRGIWIIPNRNSTSVGNGFVVSGNYIGGSAPLAAGTPMSFTGQANYFDGIRLEIADGTVANASTIQGNIITNIAQTTTITSASDAFHGIALAGCNGAVNVTGNIIGSGTAANVITINAGNGSHSIGLFVAGTTTTLSPLFNFSNNTVGGITLPGAGNNFSAFFSNNAGTTNIDGNLFGGYVASSINLSSNSNAAVFLKGINLASGSGLFNITNNNILNLSTASTGTGTTVAQVVGVAVSGTSSSATLRVPLITGNKIANLYSAAAVTGNGASAGISGIAMNSTSATAVTISGNTVDSLVMAGGTAAAANISGIYFNGSGSVTNIIAKNNIHSLEISGSSATGVITGILCNAGAANIINNMVRLGVTPAGVAISTPLTINGIMTAATVATNLYHNSVYIGGTGVGSTATNTFAFRRFSTSGAVELRNNIFVNDRSNASTGGKHYAVYLTSTSSGVTANYNIYGFGGTGGAFAYSGTADIAAYSAGAAGWLAADANSFNGTPGFINAAGNVTAGNLHISTAAPSFAEGTGTLIAAVTDDIDGDTRSGLTPVDIGADAGAFVSVSPCTMPNAPTALVFSGVSSGQMNGSFTAPVPAAHSYLVVRYPATPTLVAPVAGTLYAAGSSLGNGTVIYAGAATSFSSTGLVNSTQYNYYIYAFNNTACIGGPLYSAALSGAQATTPCSGPGGTITVGPGAMYPTLTAAFNGLASGISGPVLVELQSNYTSAAETYPVVLNFNSCFSPANTVVIRPAPGANGLVINGSNAGPTVDFNGANYVTIDGRPGGTGSTISYTASGTLHATNLNIINTNAAGAAVRFDNQASNNKLIFTDLQGQNTTAANVPAGLAGVVYFGNTGANGNDNNTVDHCNIHSTGASTPSIGVYALGVVNNGLSAAFNDADIISDNNIYDYFAAGGNSAGVELNQGVQGWQVISNHFFQSAARTYTAAGYNRAVWIVPNRTAGTSAGNGFVVSGNFIGGSEPQCGGVPYTLNGQANYFGGIRLEVADGPVVTPSSIQGNTLSNIAITSTITTASDVFQGIAVTASRADVNIGTVTGNTIGSASDPAAITIGAGSGSHAIGYFISNSNGAGSTINLKKNVVGGISLLNAGNNFSGIFDNQAGTVNIDSNLVGSTFATASINASSTSATALFVRGINISSGTGTVNITNNTIANLVNSTTSTTSGAQTAGISIGATPFVPQVVGNTIYNLSCAAPQTGGGINAALGGILFTSTAAIGSTVSNNKIHTLRSTSSSTSAAILMEGIFMSGPSANNMLLASNFIHSFDAAANPAIGIRGIEINGGTGVLVNNMLRLGLQSDGTAISSATSINGILKGTGGNMKVYYNSVYIGGTVSGTGTNATYAFRRSATSGTDDIRNNIFYNERSNAGSSGAHYAVAFATATTGATLNNNLYGYTGNGGLFANNGAADVAAYSTGWLAGDAASKTGDPRFINALGDAGTVDLHINYAAAAAGNDGAAVLNDFLLDYDNDNRHVSTPDIGADEQPGSLPVSFAWFTGSRQGTANVLSWQTAAELDNKGFELQRSADGRMFSSLYFVNSRAANGNSVLPLNYSFTDRQPLDIAYYRLRQVDKNGRSTFSAVVLLARKGGAGVALALFPNPVLNAAVTLQLEGVVPEATLKMDVCSLDGRVLLQAAGNLAQLNAALRGRVAGIPAGVYIIRVNDGKEDHVTTMVRQ